MIAKCFYFNLDCKAERYSHFGLSPRFSTGTIRALVFGSAVSGAGHDCMRVLTPGLTGQIIHP